MRLRSPFSTLASKAGAIVAQHFGEPAIVQMKDCGVESSVSTCVIPIVQSANDSGIQIDGYSPRFRLFARDFESVRIPSNGDTLVVDNHLYSIVEVTEHAYGAIIVRCHASKRESGITPW